ncbi:ABC transporter permease, partial [Puia sp.]|uniref:ABC transporter permease n=1 Tax=Puia sp. TaxID=2045100 RepID=UPI002F42A09B
MLKTHLILAWRHLSRSKSSAAINIAGLSIGMAIALVIGLWIIDEISFDHYAPHHQRLAAVMGNAYDFDATRDDQFGTDNVISVPLGKALGGEYKTLFTRTAATDFGTGGSHLFSYGDKPVSGIALAAQADLPGMFGFRMITGRDDATKDPSTVIISQSLATALFGNDNPVDKTVRMDNNTDYRIGGTYADLPQNTTFHNLQAVLPWDNKNNDYRSKNTNWNDHNSHMYVELAPGITAEQATARIKALPTPHIKTLHEEAMIYPLDKAYLYNEFKRGKPDGGRITMVWLFGIIGAFVLLLACINFMNLSTARSEKRAKEVGIRKTIGSGRSQLIRQFLSESVLIAGIALVIALLLAEASLPFFNNLSGKQMAIPWDNLLFLLATLGFTMLTGLLAGSYPAFYLSAFKPIRVLKGAIKTGKAASLPRQVLVVLQFTVSLTLIIGTTIVFRQILHTQDRPVGYNREGLFTVAMNTPDLNKHYEALRTELIQKGLAADVAAADFMPTSYLNDNVLDWSGKRPDQQTLGFRNIDITPDFGKTIGWTITRGRDMSRDFATDSNAAILNEKAAEAIGRKDPIGMTVKLHGKAYTVVGVAADMVNNSPYDTVEPAVFVGGGWIYQIHVRIKPGL